MKKLCAGMGVLLVMAGCVYRPVKPPKSVTDIYTQSGATIPAMSLTFEVNYDPRLDTVVPKYKILTVGVTNGALEYMETNSMTDEWWVVDRKGSRHKAILNIREKDPDVWLTLPPKLRQLIQYPQMVRIGDSITIDLLFPKSVSLEAFKEVVFKFPSKQKTIHIIPNE